MVIAAMASLDNCSVVGVVMAAAAVVAVAAVVDDSQLGNVAVVV